MEIIQFSKHNLLGLLIVSIALKPVKTGAFYKMTRPDYPILTEKNVNLYINLK